MNQNRFNLRTERTLQTAAKSDWTDNTLRVLIGRETAALRFTHSYWTNKRRSFFKVRLQAPPTKKSLSVGVPIGVILYAGV